MVAIGKGQLIHAYEKSNATDFLSCTVAENF